jgi:hypothetical protein
MDSVWYLSISSQSGRMYRMQYLPNRSWMKISLIDGLVDKGKQNDQQEVPAWNRVIPYYEAGKEGPQELAANFRQQEQQIYTVFKHVPQRFLQRAAYTYFFLSFL